MFNTGMRLTKSLQALPKANSMKQGTQSTFIKAACAQMHTAAAKPKFLHTFKASDIEINKTDIRKIKPYDES